MYSNTFSSIDAIAKELREYRPLAKREVQELREYYRIGLTYTSNALEGNSLTQAETKVVLEEGITIGGKLIKDHLEALGHSDAYNLLYTLVKHKEITEKDIVKLHKFFYQRIDPSRAGKYRKEQVFITGTDFIPPTAKAIPALMEAYIESLPELKKTVHPVEFAALLHLELVTIHPFIDGNGRTARLLMNLALLQDEYCITTIPAVVRADYITALQLAQKGNKQAFVNFISTMVYESLKDHVRMVRALRGE